VGVKELGGVRNAERPTVSSLPQHTYPLEAFLGRAFTLTLEPLDTVHHRVSMISPVNDVRRLE
jgi:hypothetical protein